MLRTTRCIKLTTFFALVVLLAAPLYAAPATGGVADVVLGTTQVDWVPTSNSPMVSYSLVVSGPDGVVERNFEAGETPTFNLAALAGDVDGSYSWQLTATPELSADARRRMAEARAAGTTFTPKGLPSRDELIQSGHFSVVDGAIVQPSANPEPQLGIATGGESQSSASEAIGLVNAADVVYADDLIVQRSLCVGLDCANGETFGFDTIRLKENNLRIKFEDTSAGSFPTTDWQITINDSANGGASYYRIEDITNNRVPFTIEANTPNNTLYVDQTGRVGIGTNVPVVEAHVSDGDSPTLRLEQNTSSGFQAQIWDVAGNEANFFVRDVTSGSRLPFRIRPGAPTSSIDIAADGDVGIGTASPGVDLHILKTSEAATDVQFKIETNTDPAFDFAEQDSGVTWRFINNNTALKIVDIGTGSDPAEEFALTQAGDLTITGQIFTSGDCNTGCDLVFSPDYQLPSIEEHEAEMLERRHLPAVGPTPENGPFNLSLMTGGILNELEKAHLYIAQLNDRVKQKDGEVAQLRDRLSALETALTEMSERQ